MRLAVFTNQFPSRLAPFFARDMRALLEAQVDLDVFPLYPLDPEEWAYVPDTLNDRILPRDRVHHISLGASVGAPRWESLNRLPRFLRDAVELETGALRYGVTSLAKTAYLALKAWAWAQRFGDYDHILAYWGSYVASCAYMFHRLTDPRIPFSMYARADADLYRTPIHLAKKMLYADNVFLICDFNRRYIRTKYDSIFPRLESKLHVQYSGLDPDDAPFEPAGRPPHTVLTVGRFVHLKGYHNVIHAVHALRRRGIAVKLELIGGGEEEPELRRLADVLGVGRDVTFRGWLGPDEVLRAMRQATVFVHPPVALDAMPTVIMEAMAVGTPIIASDVAGIPELLDSGRCGVLVPPGDVAALAQVIATLLADASMRMGYARAARSHLEGPFNLRQNGWRLAEHLRATQRRGS